MGRNRRQLGASRLRRKGMGTERKDVENLTPGFTNGRQNQQKSGLEQTPPGRADPYKAKKAGFWGRDERKKKNEKRLPRTTTITGQVVGGK